MSKIIIVLIIAIIIVGGGAFYGGMIYGKSKSGGVSLQNFQNLTAEQRQQRLQQTGQNGNRIGLRSGAAGANFTVGEIISKDDKSVTLKLQDGGSKIVFLSASTQYSKTDQAGLNDLSIGENITVSGQANQDGSLTAQTIQIRPILPQSATSTPAN